MIAVFAFIFSSLFGCAKKPTEPQVEAVQSELSSEPSLDDTGVNGDVTNENISTQDESQSTSQAEVTAESEPEPESDPDPDPDPEPVQEEPKINVSALISTAVALLTTDDKNNASEALRSLTDIDRQHPGHAEVAYNIGLAYLKLEKPEQARKEFLRATDIKPAFSRAWYNLGAMAERSGDIDRAQMLYESGLEYNSTSFELMAGKINVLRKGGQYDLAIQTAKEALKSNAQNVAAYNAIASVYLEQKKYSQAEFILSLALAKQGGVENAEILTSLGKVYYFTGQLFKARANLENALLIQPDLVEARSMLSMVHLDNRAWVKARDTLLPALEVDSKNPQIYNNLGIAYRGLGESEKALEYYQKALDIFPNNLDPMLNMSLVQAERQKKYADALATLDQYVERGGNRLQLVEDYREEFKKSEEKYNRDLRRKAARDRMRKARLERERKQAEERKQKELEEKNQEDRDTDSTEESDLPESKSESNDEMPSEESPDSSEEDEATEDTATEPIPTENNKVDENEDTPQSLEVEDSEPVQETMDVAPPVELPTDDPEPIKNENTQDSVDEGSEDPDSEDDLNPEDQPLINPELNPPVPVNEPDSSPESEDNDNDPWGEEDEASDFDPNMNSKLGSSCTQYDECGPTQFFACSRQGICVEAGTTGAIGIQGECQNSDECAIGLDCNSNRCMILGDQQ